MEGEQPNNGEINNEEQRARQENYEQSRQYNENNRELFAEQQWRREVQEYRDRYHPYNVNNREQNALEQLEPEVEGQRDFQNYHQEMQEYRDQLRQFNEEQNARLQQELEALRRRRRQQRPIYGIFGGFHNSQMRGLTSERVGMFQHFDADESLVGEQCIICMNDFEIGTKMVRLDCHVDHYLCKVCADRWFEDHNTCPNCRHAFD